MQRAPIVPPALSNWARQHVVGPTTSTGFNIGRDVRHYQVRIIPGDVARTFFQSSRRSARSIPIAIGMTAKTREKPFSQILTSLYSLRRTIEDSGRKGTCS